MTAIYNTSMELNGCLPGRAFISNYLRVFIGFINGLKKAKYVALKVIHWNDLSIL